MTEACGYCYQPATDTRRTPSGLIRLCPDCVLMWDES